MEGCDYMTVYIETGYDGKERKFVYGNGYYRKIYKQYKKSLNAWIEQLTKLLYKAKYDKEQIHNIVNHCYDRGYFVSSNYYIKPCSLVQRVNELGYVGYAKCEYEDAYQYYLNAMEYVPGNRVYYYLIAHGYWILVKEY